jgi:predicted dienelactone hydrolase
MGRGVTAQNALLRVGDVKFILDELEKRNQKSSGSVLAERLDLTRIGIGGHSFGSQTTLAVVGKTAQTREPRLKVAIAMSPSPSNNFSPRVTFRNITIPTLFLTGTDDNSPLDPNLKPADRLIPFREATGKDQYLAVFDKGNHMLFSGHHRPLGKSILEQRYQPLIQEITLNFLQAHLRDDDKAKQWLLGKGFDELMQGNGSIERRK